MKGHEIKESYFKKILLNKDFRIDSQFYTKEPKKNSSLKYDKIGNVLVKAQYGISIAMNEDGVGFPIYRMNEIHTMLCDTEVAKYADLTKEELKTFKLNERDVLFNRTNSFEWVGRTGLYKKLDERNFVFASYLVRFIPKYKIILPEYLTTFLSCKFGVWDIKRRARQSINQTNVNPEEVKAIEIPLLSMNFQNKIKTHFDISFDNIINSQKFYTQAEEILLNEIGLDKYKQAKDPVNIKNLKESFEITKRLDAEYYQKKYEQMIDKIVSRKHDSLINIVDIIKSIEPGSNYYSDENGLPFYRVSDYNKFGLNNPDKKLTDSFVSINKKLIEKLMPKKGTILFSKDGSVGIAYLLRQDLDGITSGAILHLLVKNKNEIIPEYLTLVLNSKLVQMQAERDAGGSIILHWRKEEIEKVVVPIIDYDKQKQIAELVEESFKLKVESERLLEVAKKAVEIAIEENESSALKFINKNIG